MPDTLWILGVRAAGVLHFVTLAGALLTPIPPNWNKSLERLPETHRRFAIAQDAFIGGVIAFCGLLCVALAPDLVSGTPLARAVCAGIAMWWGGRLAVLPWLGVRQHLDRAWMRVGFDLLRAECAIYAAAFGWLALRT